MRKTNQGQPAIAPRLPWRAGCYVAEYEPDALIGHRINAVQFTDALLKRLVRAVQ